MAARQVVEAGHRRQHHRRRPGGRASRFSRWMSDSGVSRGTSTSRRPSLSCTAAARWIRFASAAAGDRAHRGHRAGADHHRVRPRAARCVRAPVVALSRDPHGAVAWSANQRSTAPCRVHRAVAVQLERDHLGAGARRADAHVEHRIDEPAQDPGRVRRAGRSSDPSITRMARASLDEPGEINFRRAAGRCSSSATRHLGHLRDVLLRRVALAEVRHSGAGLGSAAAHPRLISCLVGAEHAPSRSRGSYPGPAAPPVGNCMAAGALARRSAPRRAAR